MKYEVFLTNEAEEDIMDIYNYVSTHDLLGRADKLFDKLKDTCLSLNEFPERGYNPPELERINVFDFLEIHYKPYKIIYQIRDHKVYIHCVIDGRRDLQELLQRRLLR